MKFEIKYTIMQALEIRLEKGESVYSQSGGMAWMNDAVEMGTTGKGGGLGGILGRALAGEGLFFTTYKAIRSDAMVTFVPDAPGKVVPLTLSPGQDIIAQRGAFLAAQESVSMKIAFTKKLGAGFFGGEGFILQRLSGPGTAWVELSGEIEQITLGPRDVLKVDPGHLAMMDPSVTYDIEMIKGLTNILFAGEGLFLATVKGPGNVWLQTMPISNLAGALKPFFPKGS